MDQNTVLFRPKIASLKYSLSECREVWAPRVSEAVNKENLTNNKWTCISNPKPIVPSAPGGSPWKRSLEGNVNMPGGSPCHTKAWTLSGHRHRGIRGLGKERPEGSQQGGGQASAGDSADCHGGGPQRLWTWSLWWKANSDICGQACLTIFVVGETQVRRKEARKEQEGMGREKRRKGE